MAFAVVRYLPEPVFADLITIDVQRVLPPLKQEQ